MRLDQLSENCYARVVFPIFTGVASILTCAQKRKDVYSLFGLKSSKSTPTDNTPPLQVVARSVANVAAAIILSLIAFHYPASHEGVKKHVLVFSTFAALTGFAGIATNVPKGDNIGTSIMVSTIFSVIDWLVWK